MNKTTTLKILGQSVELELTDDQVKIISDAYVNRTVTDRIKNFQDVLADRCITHDEFEAMIENDTEDEAAFKMAKLISLALNEGPLTTDMDYYIPVFKKSGLGFSGSDYGGWGTDASVGARLFGFKSKELSDYAGKTFESVYKPLL